MGTCSPISTATISIFPWSVDVAVRALQPGNELIYGDLGILAAEANGAPAAFSIQFYPDFDLRYYSFVATFGTANGLLASEPDGEDRLFDIRYRLIGDCEYWLRAALGGAKLRHIPELMAVQVEHGSTLRATQAPD